MGINLELHNDSLEGYDIYQEGEEGTLLDKYFGSLTEEEILSVEQLREDKVKEYLKSKTNRINNRPIYPKKGITKFPNLIESKELKNKELKQEFDKHRGELRGIFYGDRSPKQFVEDSKLSNFAKEDNYREEYYINVKYLGNNEYGVITKGLVRYTVYNARTQKTLVLYLSANKTILNYPEKQNLNYTNSLSKVNYYLGKHGYDTQYKVNKSDVEDTEFNTLTNITKYELEYLKQYLIKGYYSNLFNSLEGVYNEYKTQRGNVTPQWEEEALIVLKSVNKYIGRLDNFVNRKDIRERTHNVGQYKNYDKGYRKKSKSVLGDYKKEYNSLSEGNGNKDESIPCKLLDKVSQITKTDNSVEWD